MMEMNGSAQQAIALGQCQGSGLCPTMGHLMTLLVTSSKDVSRFDYIISGTAVF